MGTITVSGSLALEAPLDGAALGFAGQDDTLTIGPAAFGFASGPGGPISGFGPGDTIVLAAIAQAFDAFDFAPADQASFAAVADLAAIVGASFTIGVGGVESVSAAVSSASVASLVSDVAAEAGAWLGDIGHGLFGPAPNAPLTIALAAGPGGGREAVITAAADLNPCFTAGTRILTPRGDVAVEALAVGDAVITGDGEAARVLWIGQRRIDLRAHPSPGAVQPIRILAGALGDGLPARDLTVSPGHALFAEGVLIPAWALVNGMNAIRQNRARVTYFHVELARHAIIFAEGVAVESYLDTGNRGAFENAGAPLIAHPDFAEAVRAAASCAPVVHAGPAVEALRARLAGRVTPAQFAMAH